MVKTVYTEKTPLQPTDFTSFAGAGAEAWSQQFGHLSDKAYQEAHTMAMSDAALNGMQEGLKGTDAEGTDNTTEVKRKYNQTMLNTAGSVITNQVAAQAQNLYQSAVAEYGDTPQALQVFNTGLGAYGQKMQANLSPGLVPAFQKTMLTAKGVYEKSLLRGVASQSAQNQKYLAQNQVNKSAATMATLFGGQGGSYDPLVIDTNKDALDAARQFNRQSSLTGKSRATNDNLLLNTAARNIANNIARRQVFTIQNLSETKPPGAEEGLKASRQVLGDMSDLVKSDQFVRKIMTDYPQLQGLGVEQVRKFVMASGKKALEGFGQVGKNAQIVLDNAKTTQHNNEFLSTDQRDALTQSKQSLTPLNQAKSDVVLANDEKLKEISQTPFGESIIKMVDAEEKKGNMVPRDYYHHILTQAQTDPAGRVYESNYSDITDSYFNQDNMAFTPDVLRTGLITSKTESYLSTFDKTNSTKQMKEFTRQRNGLVHDKEIANGTYPANTQSSAKEQYAYYGNVLNAKNPTDLINDLRAKRNAGLNMDDLARGFAKLKGKDGFSQKVIDKLIRGTVAAQAKDETTLKADADAIEAAPDLNEWATNVDNIEKKKITGNVFEATGWNALRQTMRPVVFNAYKGLWQARYLAEQHSDDPDNLSANESEMNRSLKDFLTEHGIYASNGTGYVDLPMVVTPYGYGMPGKERVQGLASHNIAISYPLADPSHQGKDLAIKPGAIIRGMAAWTNHIILGAKDYQLRDDESVEDITDGEVVSINPTTLALRMSNEKLLMRKVGKGSNARVEPYTISTYKLQQAGTPGHG